MVVAGIQMFIINYISVVCSTLFLPIFCSSKLLLFFEEWMRGGLGFLCWLFALNFWVIAAVTNDNDPTYLLALKDIWENTPPSWVGTDPCGDRWEGIGCTNSRVTSMDLSYNTGLTGSIPPSIGNLRKLSNLILIGCGFTGPIPDSIGYLKQLVYLSLNSNGFSGPIPPSIGNLTNLYWLDLADNELSGPIPVSNGSRPGLDMLVKTKHFHFGKNQLSGEIPSQLFSSSMKLIHLLLENNQLTGSIPSTLGLVQTLEVVRLDRNSLTGPVPSNINNLSSVSDLFLSNNRLTGALPNLTGMDFLHYVMLQNTRLQGSVPVALFTAPQLQAVVLRNNQLNGTLDIGSSYSSQLQEVDLQNNFISSFTQRAGYNIGLKLSGNPVCVEEGAIDKKYCNFTQRPNGLYSTLPRNCVPSTCSSKQISSPNCQCAYPYTGKISFRARKFSSLGNSSIYISLEERMMVSFQSYRLPVNSVSLKNPTTDLDDYLVISLEIFPFGQDYFNRTGVSAIGFVLSNQTFKPPPDFGPFFFIGDGYQYFSGFYAYRQKRRAERADHQNNPFALWDPTKNSGGVPQLKGARSFSFEELNNYTNNFSETNNIGSGGYGMVYRGNLPNGQLIAIKRAVQGSTQGDLEFKTEIELLSRVHHKNVVSLVGFCFAHGEQMLIYEYIPNGTLKDSLLVDVSRLQTGCFSYSFEESKTGYMDPEYYMTQQLTEKSDVYSFGVLLLELITARPPIHQGKYIVKEVRQSMDRTKDLYNLQGVLDPNIGQFTDLRGLEKFIDTSMRCVEEAGADRPSMNEVVKEIENAMEMAGLNPNLESASTSASYEGVSKGYEHPYSNESLFVYSGAYIPSKLEPK
ncbi:hypothetical protein LguiB_021674 [Lonicera macranthoides]